MVRRFRLQICIRVAITLLALTLLSFSSVLAQEGSVKLESLANLVVPGGPGFVSVSAFAFKPVVSTDPYEYFGWALFNPSTSKSVTYAAPLCLPNGATITQFVVTYYDNDTASNISVRLNAGGFDNSGYMLLAVINSSGATNAYLAQTTNSISNPKINQQSNVYWVAVDLPTYTHSEMPPMVRLVAVRVDYAYSITLPAVMK